ncbi:hypothetical protein F4804DRAFT_268559 [Jackrogersella minutella]|nr:hypothetical protein F4804DRAFT_268559 [Jackrogersella minutella]
MSTHHTGVAAGFGPARPSVAAPGPGAVAPVEDTFTAEMRNRQARGKDPYESSDANSDFASDSTRKYRAEMSRKEAFAVQERRRKASQILDSPELLMMAAQRDNESIPATRLKYTRMFCGFEEPPSTRKKSFRGGASTSRVSSGSTPGRPSRKETR